MLTCNKYTPSHLVPKSTLSTVHLLSQLWPSFVEVWMQDEFVTSWLRDEFVLCTSWHGDKLTWYALTWIWVDLHPSTPTEMRNYFWNIWLLQEKFLMCWWTASHSWCFDMQTVYQNKSNQLSVRVCKLHLEKVCQFVIWILSNILCMRHVLSFIFFPVMHEFGKLVKTGQS